MGWMAPAHQSATVWKRSSDHERRERIAQNTAFPLDATRMSSAVERGRIFVEKNCATCHAVGHEGQSPYAPAPPFRTLHERYDVGDLAEAFAEGIIVAHNGPRPMPQFMLDAQQIDDLITYLRSLEPPRTNSLSARKRTLA
jgi:cytochrome c